MTPYRALTPILLLIVACAAQAQSCRVVDPELQARYAGACVNGLAEGFGYAGGAAEYRGEFKQGRKHGKGVKTWPSGDRYEGEFVADHKQGQGTYIWGRGPWAGERYEGAFFEDRRHGMGTYRWPSGDVYAGPWDRDLITGPATEMMLARGKFEQEARAAVAAEGKKVCREMDIGLAEREWVRGIVVAVEPARVGVRIEEPGRHPHVIGGAEARRDAVVWDVPHGWMPCL